jgi:pre-mRNA-splicing factor SYF2/beta-D-xylosidase 4
VSNQHLSIVPYGLSLSEHLFFCRCSYNAINSVGACFHGDLQNDLLRTAWGFNGSVVSDCDAIKDQAYRYASPEAAVAAGVQGGCDQDCGGYYGDHGVSAVQKGLLKEAEMDLALTRTLLMRFRLGEFDDPKASADLKAYTTIPAGTSNSTASSDSALRAARESIVLLNNSASPVLLPLKPTATGADGKIKVALIGPFADDAAAMQGAKSDYSPAHIISYQEGLSGRSDQVTVNMVKGCADVACNSITDQGAVIAAAKMADVVVMTMGIDAKIEGEGHDRKDASLPGQQLALVQAVVKAVGANKVVVCLSNGGSLSVDWIRDNVPTVLELFLGGQWAGTAFAEILLGDVSPSGMLPYTVYPADFLNKAPMLKFEMRPDSSGYPGRTYRFYNGPTLWPFGHGLSYTSFKLEWASTPSPSSLATSSLVPSPSASTMVTHLKVTNTGKVPGSKPIQAYVLQKTSEGAASHSAPLRTLIGVHKVFLMPGQSTTVAIDWAGDAMSSNDHQVAGGATLGYCAFCTVAADGRSRAVQPGDYELVLGNGATTELSFDLRATGEAAPVAI